MLRELIVDIFQVALLAAAGRRNAYLRVAAEGGDAAPSEGPATKGKVSAWDWGLQLFPTNEECLVSAESQSSLRLCLSLPFVHTARRARTRDLALCFGAVAVTCVAL